MNKKVVKLVSFTAGFVIIATAVGVVVYKNPSIKREIEQQLKGCIKTSRSALETIQETITKIQEATGLLSDRKIQKEAELDERASLLYEEEWEKHIF